MLSCINTNRRKIDPLESNFFSVGNTSMSVNIENEEEQNNTWSNDLENLLWPFAELEI